MRVTPFASVPIVSTAFRLRVLACGTALARDGPSEEATDVEDVASVGITISEGAGAGVAEGDEGGAVTGQTSSFSFSVLKPNVCLSSHCSNSCMDIRRNFAAFVNHAPKRTSSSFLVA